MVGAWVLIFSLLVLMMCDFVCDILVWECVNNAFCTEIVLNLITKLVRLESTDNI